MIKQKLRKKYLSNNFRLIHTHITIYIPCNIYYIYIYTYNFYTTVQVKQQYNKYIYKIRNGIRSSSCIDYTPKTIYITCDINK